jgi:alkanesulfonate monooxygenase SsuD/methylene tetrahydromethanopterin reductase-like flavin-dependent oxidoreductase (luciferase family)
VSGIPYDPGRIRVERLRESLQVLKLLFGDEPAAISGRHWTVTGLTGVPAPMQRPHPPLMVGGTGPRLLRMAAEEADIVGFDSGPATMDPSTWSLSALAEKARLVREAAQSPDVELHLNPDVWAVGANRSQAVDAAARAAGVDANRLHRSVFVLAGTVQQVVEQLEAVRPRGSPTYRFGRTGSKSLRPSSQTSAVADRRGAWLPPDGEEPARWSASFGQSFCPSA